MTSDFPVESGPWAKTGSEYAIKLTNNNDATNPIMILLFNTYSLKNIQLTFTSHELLYSISKYS